MVFKVICRNVGADQLLTGDSVLDIFYGMTEDVVDKMPFFFALLSDHERERANRFKHKADYHCFVAVHALLRIELSKLLGSEPGTLRIGVSKYGKPFIHDIDLPFSLSRSKNLFSFVIGHSNQIVGVDIERIKSSIDISSISKNYFGIREQQLILSFKNIEDQNRTFFEIWTRKEAFLKTIGIGLATDLKKVSLLEGENRVDVEGASASPEKFLISTINHNQSIISVSSSTDFIPRFKALN